MVFTVNAGSLARESVEHLSRLGGRGLALSLAALPFRRASKAAQRRALRDSLRRPINYTDALCALTRHITHVDMHREPGEQLAGFICEAFAMDAVAIFDMDLNTTYSAGYWFADPENNLRNICMFERSSADSETGLISEVLRIGSLPIGSLLLRGDMDPSLVSGIGNLIATTFDRYHSRANLSRVESAREAERLRTTVLDSLAHTYKTPLTAIRAAVTGISEIGSLGKAQAELLAIIEEQSTLLNELTVRLLTTARLENHELSLHKDPFALATLVEDAISVLHAQYPGLQIGISMTQEDITLICDRSLISALLAQYLDNAAKYSEFGSAVTVAVEQQGEAILFSVHNFGPVIPPSEYECIFERFVRGADTSAGTPGTGIGLSIARAAAHAHGGDVWLTSNAAEGTTFYASVPIARSDATDE